MLHCNRESAKTAERAGVCLCVGFHLSANLIDTLSCIPISTDGKIKPAHSLWSNNLIYLCIRSTMSDPQNKNRNRGREHQRTGGSLPCFIPCHTAYGQTHFSPIRHKTNDSDTTPTAQATTVCHLKQDNMEFVAVVMRSLIPGQQPMVAWGL